MDRTRTALTNFRKDERGAIMVMGVFLSCSLIAGMWYMMGIGDAILWRDRSQEAADSIAFTTAAVHARGMNFISAVNIMMLIIVTVYVVMCLVRAIMDILLFVTGDPWKSRCEFWNGIFETKDTTGHGLFSATGLIPPGIDAFGAQFVGFMGGQGPPRYRRTNLFGIWGTLSDVDAWGTGAGLRDYVVNSGKCGACISSIVTTTSGIISAASIVGLAAAAAGLVGTAATCTMCVKACKSNCPFQRAAEPLAKGYHFVEDFIEKYEARAMKPILPRMHDVEVVTARLTPWVGAVAGAYEGYQYSEKMTYDNSQVVHHMGVPITASMFPDLKPKKTIKEMKPNCADTGGSWPDCLNYIPFKGNGCGPMLCNDNMVSHSGGWKPCDKTKETCDGTSSSGKTDIKCCDYFSEPGCQVGNSAVGVCGSGHGGVASEARQKELLRDKKCQNNKRIGLPVEAVNMNELCHKAGSYAAEFIGGMFATTPVISQILALTSKIGSAISKIPLIGGKIGPWLMDPVGQLSAAIGNKMKIAFCVGDEDDGSLTDRKKYGPAMGARHSSPDSDYKVILTHDFWYNDDECSELKGPMKVVDYAKNGNDWFQVYGIVFPQYYNLTRHEYASDNRGNWSKLRLAVGPKESGKSAYDDNATNMDAMLFYIAEAEYYHDCDAEWDDPACNGNDRAVYRMNWRTRLRRVHKPEWLSDAIGSVPLITQFNSVSGLVISHQAQIVDIVDTVTGVNVQGPINVLENINNITASGANLPNMIH